MKRGHALAGIALTIVLLAAGCGSKVNNMDQSTESAEYAQIAGLNSAITAAESAMINDKMPESGRETENGMESLVQEAEGDEPTEEREVTEDADIYSKPGEEGAVVGSVKQGTTVQTIDMPGSEKWCKIVYKGRVAYILSNVLTVPEPEVTVAPTAGPTARPAAQPASGSTAGQGTEPTRKPAAEPTRRPAAEPTYNPASGATAEPIYSPVPGPAGNPDAGATQSPTSEPTVKPTQEPAEGSTQSPTLEPTTEPTQSPTSEPTAEPTQSPTSEPTAEPTQSPTSEPTTEPTQSPTSEPTAEPTQSPTSEPTTEPTQSPTSEPTDEPEPTTYPASELSVELAPTILVWAAELS